MTTPALAWIVAGLATTIVFLVVAIALVRQGILVGRTAIRLAREAGDVAQGIGAAGRARDARR